MRCVFLFFSSLSKPGGIQDIANEHRMSLCSDTNVSGCVYATKVYQGLLILLMRTPLGRNCVTQRWMWYFYCSRVKIPTSAIFFLFEIRDANRLFYQCVIWLKRFNAHQQLHTTYAQFLLAMQWMRPQLCCCLVGSLQRSSLSYLQFMMSDSKFFFSFSFLLCSIVMLR